LNIIEPVWSVLETGVKNRLQPPTSLKKLEDVLREEWYKTPLQTVQNLHEFIARWSQAVLKAEEVHRHINKEVCTVSVAFPLVCPAPVYIYV
jgi:hypothetical protein